MYPHCLPPRDTIAPSRADLGSSDADLLDRRTAAHPPNLVHRLCGDLASFPAGFVTSVRWVSSIAAAMPGSVAKLDTVRGYERDQYQMRALGMLLGLYIHVPTWRSELCRRRRVQGRVRSCGRYLRFEPAMAMSVWQRRDGLRWHILDARRVGQLFGSLR